MRLGLNEAMPHLAKSEIKLSVRRTFQALRIEVNQELAYALVEPGVTYLDLYKFIQDKKYPLWIDCTDPGWGSVIGNALDHGAGRTPLPYRDHFGAHCGMEVVLANGDVVRTGMGAMPNAKTWGAYKSGFGP